MSHSPPHVIEDCRGLLQLLSDGTILRRSPNNFPAPSPGPHHHHPPVIFKDAQFDPTHNLALRLYKPAGPQPTTKLPILFYFHGGGFCLGSFSWPQFHSACLRLSSDLNCVVVAPDYRLAPEARLPAAIRDAESTILWTRPGSDPFLSDADFNNMFVSGESAGGNIAHHMALNFGPRLIRGYILLLPFFGGDQRTESEAHCPKDAFISLELSDRYWRLALPLGATREDPLANPFGPNGPRWEEVEIGPMMVVVGGRDMLRDRGVEYGTRLREMGTKGNVEVVEIDGEEHGFFPRSPWSEAADELVRVMKRFIDANKS